MLVGALVDGLADVGAVTVTESLMIAGWIADSVKVPLDTGLGWFRRKKIPIDQSRAGKVPLSVFTSRPVRTSVTEPRCAAFRIFFRVTLILLIAGSAHHWLLAVIPPI